MNLEVWFLQPDEVTVFLESSISDPDDEKLYEAMVFGLFASRQICNNRGVVGQSLAEVLFSFEERHPLPQLMDALREIKVGSPTTKGGRKGFTCTFSPNKRAFFKLHPHGFGVLGKGVDYYAPTSTLAVLFWLLSRRDDDVRYQLALGMTAKMIGAAGVSGQISIRTQSDIALQAASAGWMHPDDMVPEGEEVSDEVRQLCQAHEIEFGDLYVKANRLIVEETDDLGPGEIRMMREDAATRTCRLVVAGEAGLISGEHDAPLNIALRAAQAAAETDNEHMIMTAIAHYDSELARVLEEAGLVPVVEALQGMVTTDDHDEVERR